MRLAGYEFAHVCDLNPTRQMDGCVEPVAPQSRYLNKKGLPLNRYGAGPFCKFRIPNNLRWSGVYAITIADELRYIGECENLSKRFNAGYGNISPKNCFKSGRETNCRVNNLIYAAACQGLQASLWFFESGDRKTVESVLLATLKLAWNRRGQPANPAS